LRVLTGEQLVVSPRNIKIGFDFVLLPSVLDSGDIVLRGAHPRQSGTRPSGMVFKVVGWCGFTRGGPSSPVGTELGSRRNCERRRA